MERETPSPPLILCIKPAEGMGGGPPSIIYNCQFLVESDGWNGGVPAEGGGGQGPFCQIEKKIESNFGP